MYQIFAIDLALAQSVTKFMVQDKFKNPLNLTEHWKSETNLSRTMKFIPDFCHRLSIGPVRETIYGPRQICLGFLVLFFYLSWTFQCLSWSKTNLSQISSALFYLSWTFQCLSWSKTNLSQISSALFLFVLDFSMLIMVQDKFVSDFQCSFFICLGLFNAYHH